MLKKIVLVVHSNIKREISHLSHFLISWLVTLFDLCCEHFLTDFLYLLFTKVPFLENTELPFIRLLSTKVKPANFHASEYIVRKGDIGQEMFIIRKGLVSFYVNFHIRRHCRFLGKKSLERIFLPWRYFNG